MGTPADVQKRTGIARRFGAFVAERADVDLVPLSLPVGQAAGIGWQILPGEGDLDGMYYALLRKR